MTEMERLAERVEAASGPDRDLDAEIAIAALCWREIASEEGDYRSFLSPDDERVNVYRRHGYASGERDKLPLFTASLDAAITLVAEGHVWMVANTGIDDPKADLTKATAMVGLPDDIAGDPVSAKTPPLALCAASLRARAKEGE